MSDYNILALYPRPGRRIDLSAALRAWLDFGGKFESNLASKLEAFDPERHVEPVSRGYYRFDPNDLDTLRPGIDAHDLKVILNAPWFTMPIVVVSYHHANDPLLFWSYDPALWGVGQGGGGHADAALLAFARGLGAAYVLAVADLGYEIIRHRFIRAESGYRFILPPVNPKRGHNIAWVDVCSELGGETPSGFIEERLQQMPFGYMRHFLVGTNADQLDTE